MIELMDVDKDGSISLEEFENFMKEEIFSGKDILEGEYVLPSGQALPMGHMLMKMKRQQMMSEALDPLERQRLVSHGQELMQKVQERRKMLEQKSESQSRQWTQSTNRKTLPPIQGAGNEKRDEDDDFIDDVYSGLKQVQMRVGIDENECQNNSKKKSKGKGMFNSWHDVMTLPLDKSLTSARGRLRELRNRTPWLPQIRTQNYRLRK
eukprot:TRINITY_DN2488_c0_g1_i1.p1 TRINITY_DN2488_c0_g1~~TRINITY_DN2488_c0_g1_i1.p1  ORF type:complete len:208 (+),score=33.66 TRINITY_DN2488_c0_g1_i1:627-1250(+)